MVGEVVAGLIAHSLALLADAAHMLTDAAALGLAIVAIRIAGVRPKGAYTYGFARVDALSGQANGMTLLLLAVWFAVEGVAGCCTRRACTAATVAVVAAVGAAGQHRGDDAGVARADRSSLNVRGVVAHLVTDVWAFGATLVAGLVVLTTGWTRADPVATLVVAAVMAWTGAGWSRAPAGSSSRQPRPVSTRQRWVVTWSARRESRRCTTCMCGRSARTRPRCRRTSWCTRPTTATKWPPGCEPPLAAGHGIGHVTLQVDHADDATGT